MNSIEEKVIGNYKIEIFPDEDPESPRSWDNMGTMVCFHGRYNLGDEHYYSPAEYSGWEEMERAIIKDNDVAVILPLYLYDHSGITMSTRPFSCPWDSGQVGFIYISKAKLREEYSRQRVTEKLKKRAKRVLENEVEVYDQYLRGDIYGFRITNIKTDEDVDSCWGYYGTEECVKCAESSARHFMKMEEDGQLKIDYK